MPSLGVYTIMCTASGTAYHHGCCTVSGAFNASHPSPPSTEEGGAAIFAFRTFLRSSRPHRLLLHRRSLHQRLRCIVSGRPPAAYRLIDNALYRCQLYCTVAYCTVSLPTVLHRCLLCGCAMRLPLLVSLLLSLLYGCNQPPAARSKCIVLYHAHAHAHTPVRSSSFSLTQTHGHALVRPTSAA